jgi:hypothetical protein
LAGGTTAVTRADADRAWTGQGSSTSAGDTGDDRERQRGLGAPEIGGGVIVGFAGGTILGFAGAYTGAYLATRNRCSGEDCGLAAAILGFLVGESVGIATGTHIGAGGKGNLLLEAVVTTAITAAGVAVIAGYHNSSSSAIPITLGLMPLAQLAAVLAIEAH